ncbi:MAG: DUF5655 domain-containing protein [Alphaproteobacteria bacterium]
MSLFYKGKRFLEKKYSKESDYENTLLDNYKLLFGEKTVYIPKKKIATQELGKSIPDGFLFDFTKPESPDFYLVEFELVGHSFFNHIFPQVTKFFAFFKNSSSRTDLIEKIFIIVNTDSELKSEFIEYIGTNELYKGIKDIVEDSQNILLVIDEKKPELPEIMATYTDTWDKMVKIMIIKEFHNNGEVIFTSEPDFEVIEMVETNIEEAEDDEPNNLKKTYTEEFHLEGVENQVKEIYETIKNSITDIKINPQKYYVSIQHNKKNFAYLYMRKKKVRLVITMPSGQAKQKIKQHEVEDLSESVQKFYGVECCELTINSIKNIDEIIALINENKTFKPIRKK